ncbi:hypothetical protein PHLCEN_2v9767 [Hermanssonia centrifuga]|uniref:Uncharacterized protein n=1 Tax=Hermanssonia centrifuga TaxID=98765 RepID=A0A2R6NQ01_9APHY|nr:hypothetical protein PHLCEN_2v9767 [Hermanssonia centrifuga]
MVNNARLFIELIRKASGDSYPSWAPPRDIKVGDYGAVNRETGEFEPEGSIYDDEFAPELEIKKNHPIEPCWTDDKYVITSRGCKGLTFDADVNTRFPELVRSDITGRWEFQRGQGAILMMFRPQESRIKGQGTLLPKLQHKTPLSDKALVTSVYSCPMYALLLASEKDVKADAAIGLSLANVGGASVRGTWHCYSSSGVWRTGGQNGDATFRPLYRLRTPKTKNFLEKLFDRRGASVPEGENTFQPYHPPWGQLDEGGEEVPPESPDDDPGFESVSDEEVAV